MTDKSSPPFATRGRNELLTALRDANEGWLPEVGKVFTVTLDPAERDILTSALSETRQKHDKDLARYVSEGLSIRNALLEEAAEVCDTLATNGRIGDTQAGRHAAGALDIAAYKIRALKGSAPSAIERKGFGAELTGLINRYSCENESNTPDFILAAYLGACLDAFDAATVERERWYGREPSAPTTGEAK